MVSDELSFHVRTTIQQHGTLSDIFQLLSLFGSKYGNEIAVNASKNTKLEETQLFMAKSKGGLLKKKEPSDVHDPKTRKQLSTILTRKAGRSGCSRSIANLKDVIHGSKRHLEKPPSCSPRSIGSSEFLNPITHEVILSNSRCELKITGFGGFQDSLTNGGPGGHPTMHYFNPSFKNSSTTTPPRKSPFLVSEMKGCGGNGHSSNRVPFDADSNGSSTVTCHKCGEQFSKWEAAETHHLSKHAVVKHSPSLAVTELVEGDSSRKIVEIICRTSWLKSENHCGRIERVLKVHNMQKTLARFEDYREMVKIKASKLPKKHPRCIADGNELLRNGFSAKKELKEGLGVFTTSTSGRAFESIQILEDDPSIRKALIVCRVIAGRVHRPLENIQEMAGQTGFDSLAGKVGLYLNIEELYLLNPRALLPCFVVICKP
ncbi:hypothetical protein GOBAR_DD20526 [Gossypium barbadense]|nr:hypothetical protein GOBAR_DD20526 [Gossypium barbadense]